MFACLFSACADFCVAGLYGIDLVFSGRGLLDLLVCAWVGLHGFRVALGGYFTCVGFVCFS